jgi:hypothetical protein
VDIIQSTDEKLEGLAEKAKALLDARLIQPAARLALDKLIERVRDERDALGALTPAADWGTLTARCDVALEEVARLTPLLGFAHRSKSAANPFEMYGPLQKLARRVIGNDVWLVVSSEWDFSPFTMPHGSTLDGFVFVGMPATVRHKALVVPLAAHEFGHSVWVVSGLDSKFESECKQAVWDAIRAVPNVLGVFGKTHENELLTHHGKREWLPAFTWALSQVEELYCDLMGLRVFGTSYLHAFSYLLAPGLGNCRPRSYPHPRIRADVLLEAGKHWGFSAPTDFDKAFPAAPDYGASLIEVLQQVADVAAQELAPQIRQAVEDHCAAQGIGAPRPDIISKISSELQLLTPSSVESSLAELLCAGWELRARSSSLWPSRTDIEVETERVRILDELLLKSAEVMEYHFAVDGANP